MKQIFFIADAHLSSEYPDREDMLLSFMNMVISEGGDLYILGDFFDYWANNRAVFNAHKTVLGKIREITSRGATVGMVLGNRDLLLNQRVLLPFGAVFLGEEAHLHIDNKNIFITHGHTLCTQDLKFQYYKQQAWPLYRLLDTILPGALENYLAKIFMLKSKQVISSQDQENFQHSQELIEKYFQKGADTIICGHSHKPMKQEFGEKCFYVLPAWEHGAGGYLLYTAGDFVLKRFPDNTQ